MERYNKYGKHTSVPDCAFSNDISNSTNGGITVKHASRLNTWLSTPDVYTIKSALMRLKGVICIVNIRSDASFTYLDEPDGAFGQNLNHAVCIVGWDDSAGGGSWIVKNSWGSGRNCQYFYMKYGHGRNCMIIDEVVINKPSNFISDIFSGDASLDYDGVNICPSKPLKWCDGTNGIKIAVAKNYTKKYVISENKKRCFQTEFRPYDCNYLGSGSYLTDIWAVEFDISYSGSSVSSYDGFSNGKLATASIDCQNPAPYACGIYKVNEVAKTATLYTLTFQMYDAVGNRFWFPYPPENIQVGYKEYSVSCFKPTFNSTNQDITPIINLLLND
ncbi:MAG: hypothetical protein JXB49_12630 [Bacteroidales bacterium]|nr:hypothetical protein [Bacteroidales bacterium]